MEYHVGGAESFLLSQVIQGALSSGVGGWDGGGWIK